MTFSGSMAAINAALAGLSFSPDADYHGGALLTITTDDLGNTGSGGPLTDTDTVAITIVSVNDAPAGADKTVTIDEDTTHTFVTADFGFSDPNDSPANDFASVLITSIAGGGSLTLDGDPVTVGDEVSVADIAAGDLKFTPAANANGAAYASIGFRVRDDGGTANGGINLDPTPNTITINVTAVNDAPVVTFIGLNQTTEWMRATRRRMTSRSSTSRATRSAPSRSPVATAASWSRTASHSITPAAASAARSPMGMTPAC